MTTKYFEERAREIRERLEAEDVDQGERDQLAAELNSLVIEMAPPIRRSRMSVQQKSAFIAERGADEYLSLPWS